MKKQKSFFEIILQKSLKELDENLSASQKKKEDIESRIKERRQSISKGIRIKKK